ncbi:hypothetical protein [Nocardioides maradonensis]
MLDRYGLRPPEHARLVDHATYHPAFAASLAGEAQHLEEVLRRARDVSELGFHPR